MQTNTILHGDIRQLARALTDGSVHCIVTSPPYYGLRDYQTAEWEGGREDCDHKEATARNDGGRVNTNGFHGSSRPDSDKGAMNYKDICPKCGAIRKDAQIGLEASPQEYVETLVGIFRELRRVLRDDGSLWLNLGDSYAGSWGNYGARNGNQRSRIADRWHRPAYEDERLGWDGLPPTANVPGLKPKDLIGIPWRVALALQADGWYLRSDIIWSKPNPMPESVTDRPTKAHEYIFLLNKSPRYYYDAEAIREPDSGGVNRATFRGGGRYTHNHSFDNSGLIPPDDTGRQGKPSNGRNRRTVWTVASKPFSGAHFATFPPDLIRPCILAGCPERCCAECGAPWVRVVEREATNHRSRFDRQMATGGAINGGVGKNFPDTKIASVGFRPTCTCTAPTVPGIVLDPFMGSGTVAQVAIEEGRNWIGCELNQDYINLAWQRINVAMLAKVAGRDYAKQMTKAEDGYRQLGLIGNGHD